VQSLIDALTASLNNALPELKNARYEFKTRTFRTSQGELLSDETLDNWRNSYPRIGAAGAGRNSLKRGILFNTISRTEGGEIYGLLELALRISHQLVTRCALDGPLYDNSFSKFNLAFPIIITHSLNKAVSTYVITPEGIKQSAAAKLAVPI
jgi:hypothetical protein